MEIKLNTFRRNKFGINCAIPMLFLLSSTKLDLNMTFTEIQKPLNWIFKGFNFYGVTSKSYY